MGYVDFVRRVAPTDILTNNAKCDRTTRTHSTQSYYCKSCNVPWIRSNACRYAASLPLPFAKLITIISWPSPLGSTIFSNSYNPVDWNAIASRRSRRIHPRGRFCLTSNSQSQTHTAQHSTQKPGDATVSYPLAPNWHKSSLSTFIWFFGLGWYLSGFLSF